MDATEPREAARGVLPSVTLSLAGRIRAEYDEMPGLSLTLRQAVRFWGLDPGTCTGVLDELVRQGYLRRAGNRYLRAR